MPDDSRAAARPSRLRAYVDVAVTLAGRELFGRRHGSALGLLLALAVPAAFLLVYGLVFSTVIPIKLRPDATREDYAFFLFAGLVAWNLVSETVASAPGLYTRSAALVRKASFPSSALVVSGALAAWCHGLLWIAVFAIVRMATGTTPPPTAVLAPVALVLVAIFAAGAALMFASIGALLRELSELVPPALALAFFLSPVLYPAERLASVAPWLVDLNPLTPMLGLLRAQLLEGSAGAPNVWLAAAIWSLASLALGSAVQRRAQAPVADLIG